MKLASASILSLAAFCAGCSAVDPDWRDFSFQLPLLTLEEARWHRDDRTYDVDSNYWVPSTRYVLHYPEPEKPRVEMQPRKTQKLRTPKPAIAPSRTAAEPETDTTRQANLVPAAPKAPPQQPPAQIQPAPAAPSPAPEQAKAPLAPPAEPKAADGAAPDDATDCPLTDDVCSRKLAAMLADTSNVWVFASPKPTDYLSGVRLYAYSKRRENLNCTDLNFGIKETTATLDHLASAANSNVVSEKSKEKIERVRVAAAKIRTDLAETEKQKCGPQMPQ